MLATTWPNGVVDYYSMEANSLPVYHKQRVGLHCYLRLSVPVIEAVALPLWHKAEAIAAAHDITHAGEGQVCADNF